MKILLFLILFSSYAQENISCSNGDCIFSGNLNVSNETELLDNSQFEIEFLEEDIDIELPDQAIPRDFVSLIRTKDEEGKDFNISLSSTNKSYDSPNFILFSDIIDILQINTSGYNGIVSNNASNICAERIKSGFYGNSIRSFYLSRRSSDNLLPDYCDSIDVAQIKSGNFSCDIGDSVVNEEITAQRWEEKSQCEGNAFRFLCIDRKLNMNCRWLSDGGSIINESLCCDNGGTKPAGDGWTCEPSFCNVGLNNSGWAKDHQVKVAESDYNADLLSGKTSLQICNQYFDRIPESDYFSSDFIHYGFFSGTFKNRPGSLNTSIKYPNNDTVNYKLLPNLTEYSGGAVSKCSSYSGCFDSENSDLGNVSKNTNNYASQNVRFSLGSGGYYNNAYELSCNTDTIRTQCNLWIDNIDEGEGWDKVTGFSYFIKYKFLSSKGYVVEQVQVIGRGHE
jgi:hypothetical protein